MGSAVAAWETLEDAATEHVDLVALQEVKLCTSEYKSFDTRAAALGYACFGVPASSKARDGRDQEGVVLLVSKLYKSRPAAKFSSCGGQASLVWVDGSLFGSCYADTSRPKT